MLSFKGYTCIFFCCQDGLQGMQGRHQMDRFSEIRSENSRIPGDHYSQESHPQSMLNSGCQQSYGLDHYQQGLKRDAMTRQDNWDLKRQRYWLKHEGQFQCWTTCLFLGIHLNLAKSKYQLFHEGLVWVKYMNFKAAIYVHSLQYMKCIHSVQTANRLEQAVFLGCGPLGESYSVF